MGEHNWAGNVEYRARTLHRPSRLEEVREIVAGADRIRVLGSRHSFTDIADSEELLSLDGLPADISIDRAQQTVSCSGAVRYGDLAAALEPEGLALANLASLPHISVAGAVATATHGSGDANRNLATAVAALEMVTSSGDLIARRRGDADFEGLVVGLGALGVVTRVTLDAVPAYQVRQRVFEGLTWEALFEHFDEITSAGYSVSVFTRWKRTTDQIWVKSRVGDEPESERESFLGARPAIVDRHPILGDHPVNCSPQLGAAGSWSDRLPHFRMGFTPSDGEEIQSEFILPRAHAAAAIEAMLGLAETVRPLLLVSEIRTVAADALWLSPQYGRDTVAIHFTWVRDQRGVERALVDVEAALAPFDARPHWGKVFRADAAAIASLYERLPDFLELREKLDPRDAFRNPWLDTHVLGSPILGPRAAPGLTRAGLRQSSPSGPRPPRDPHSPAGGPPHRRAGRGGSRRSHPA